MRTQAHLFTSIIQFFTKGKKVIFVKKTMMNIGLKIKRLREIQGRSQKDIADLLNVDRRTYAKWEEGVTDIRSSLIPDIAEIFGVDIADLYKNINDAEIKDTFSYRKNSVNSVIIMITDRDMAERFLHLLNESRENNEK